MKTTFTAAELEQLRNLVAPANMEIFEKITKPENVFTKDKLTTGDKVKLRNGNIYMVVENCNTRFYGMQNFTLFGLRSNAGFIVADEYSQTLEFTDIEWRCFDVVEVYRDGEGYISAQTLRNDIDLNKYKLIWRREE